MAVFHQNQTNDTDIIFTAHGCECSTQYNSYSKGVVIAATCCVSRVYKLLIVLLRILLDRSSNPWFLSPTSEEALWFLFFLARFFALLDISLVPSGPLRCSGGDAFPFFFVPPTSCHPSSSPLPESDSIFNAANLEVEINAQPLHMPALKVKPSHCACLTMWHTCMYAHNLDPICHTHVVCKLYWATQPRLLHSYSFCQGHDGTIAGWSAE